MSESEDFELVNLSNLSDNDSQDQLVSLGNNSISQQRQIAKRNFYKNKKTMSQRVQQSHTVGQLLQKTIDQMALSYDNLSGTQQMLLDQGQILNSTVLVGKKVQVLSTITDALKKKNDIQRQNKSIDVTSPQVQLLIKVVLENVFNVIKQNVPSSDQQILIINKISQSLQNWDKQFKQRLTSLQSL